MRECSGLQGAYLTKLHASCSCCLPPADRARSMDGESSVVALLPMFVRANASEAAAWGFDEAPECAAGTLPCYDPQIGWAW